MPESTVFVVAEQPEPIRRLIRSEGMLVRVFASHLDFFAAAPRTQAAACLVTDDRSPLMTALELQQELMRRRLRLSIVFLCEPGGCHAALRSSHPIAVEALEQPCDDEKLLGAVRRGIKNSIAARARDSYLSDLRARLDRLTPREQQVMRLLLDGAVNKMIARELDLSVRTVETHRARILAKMGVSNAAQLVKRVVVAGALERQSQAERRSF